MKLPSHTICACTHARCLTCYDKCRNLTVPPSSWSPSFEHRLNRIIACISANHIKTCRTDDSGPKPNPAKGHRHWLGQVAMNQVIRSNEHASGDAHLEEFHLGLIHRARARQSNPKPPRSQCQQVLNNTKCTPHIHPWLLLWNLALSGRSA